MNREMAEIIRNQKPLTLPPSATVQEACKHMHQRKIGAVLVTRSKGELVGIFTGRDAVRVLAEGKAARSTHLRHVMTEGAGLPAAAPYRDPCAAADARRRIPPRAGGARGRRDRHRLARRFPRAGAGPAGRGDRDLGADALEHDDRQRRHQLAFARLTSAAFRANGGTATPGCRRRATPGAARADRGRDACRDAFQARADAPPGPPARPARVTTAHRQQPEQQRQHKVAPARISAAYWRVPGQPAARTTRRCAETPGPARRNPARPWRMQSRTAGALGAVAQAQALRLRSDACQAEGAHRSAGHSAERR